MLGSQIHVAELHMLGSQIPLAKLHMLGLQLLLAELHNAGRSTWQHMQASESVKRYHTRLA
jgi:hypothetical protein